MAKKSKSNAKVPKQTTRKDGDRPLTLRQKRFLKYYIEDPTNATEAARKAGYSPKSANSMAHQLLHNPLLLPHLEKIAEENEYDYGLEAQDILQKLNAIAELNIFDFIEINSGRSITVRSLDDIPHEYGQFVRTIKENMHGIEISFYDKIKCLELLAKIKGLLNKDDAPKEKSWSLGYKL